ncbi:MAG: hypothetical protein O9289_21115 [Rhodobacteraceae bacterium]|nr:hypothetical protein [Paracoccaceae bacterium]MCZ8085680.1 hypothetical protein [Paracoccaceae bacterium]
MAQTKAAAKAPTRTIHTRHLGETRYRDLKVHYDKGGMNYWDYSRRPKGIYFASELYQLSSTSAGAIRTWSTGQKGDGYLLVTELETYSAKALRLVQERVRTHADHIHDFLDGRCGTLADLKALLAGTASSVAAPSQEAA